MTLTHFYLALPDAPQNLPRSRRRAAPSEDESCADYAPYLRGLPTLPAFLAHLACLLHLTRAEEDCLTRRVGELAQRIRAARTDWEATQTDAINAP